MKIVCPNKNDPAWKTLVDAVGEDLAYLSFFRNHDVIPSVATARAILKLKEPVETVKSSRVPESRPRSLTPEQILSKSKKPKATVPEKVTRFRRVAETVNVRNFRDADTASFPILESVH